MPRRRRRPQHGLGPETMTCESVERCPGERLLAHLALAIACLAIQPSLARTQPAVHTTRILVLYALAPDAPAAPPLIERLRTTIHSQVPAPVEMYVEYLDLDRFPDAREAARLGRFLNDK